MCLPFTLRCTRPWVDLPCCGLVAEQEQDLCGQCRAAPKWARRRVARAKSSRPPAPPPTHLPARPDPHRSWASRALLRPTSDVHLPARSAAFLPRTAQNARNLACRPLAAGRLERSRAPVVAILQRSAYTTEPGDGKGRSLVWWGLGRGLQKLAMAVIGHGAAKTSEPRPGFAHNKSPVRFGGDISTLSAPARTR